MQMRGPGPEEFYRQEAERRERTKPLADGADTSSIRHYLAGLIVFGVASLVVAVVVAYLATMTAMFVALPIFAILLAGLGFLAMRARYADPRFTWLHGGFMVAWTAAFIGTMLLLTSELGGEVGLYVAGGVGMLVVSLITAFVGAWLSKDRRRDDDAGRAAPDQPADASADDAATDDVEPGKQA